MNNSKVREINNIVRQMFPDVTDEQTLKLIARKAKKYYTRSKNGRDEQRGMET